MLNKLEKHGGICDSQASRDTFIYAASAYTSGLNDVIHLLAEATLRPQITPDEVDGARQAISFETESLNMRPEQETLLMDMVHAVNLDFRIKFLLYLKKKISGCLQRQHFRLTQIVPPEKSE